MEYFLLIGRGQGDDDDDDNNDDDNDNNDDNNNNDDDNDNNDDENDDILYLKRIHVKHGCSSIMCCRTYIICCVY